MNWAPHSVLIPAAVLASIALPLHAAAADEEALPPAESGSAADADALRDARDSGFLQWGADAQGGAPYVFQDPTDPSRMIGFEVEIAEALARRIGASPLFVQGQWDKLLDLVGRGDFHCALNGIEATETTRQVALVTRAYYVAAERLVVRRGDPDAPRTREALRGRKIGTLPGSYAERVLIDAGADVKTYDGGQEQPYMDLALKRLDGVLMDEPIAIYYGMVRKELELVPGSFGEVRYVVACGLEQSALRAALDRALGELAADGTLRAIFERWGIWNAETATELGVEWTGASGQIPVRLEEWRRKVGAERGLADRLRDYPRYQGLFLRGALLTLALSLAAFALAVALGLTLAVCRQYGPRPLRWFAWLYVELVRGTPLLIQLFFIYFGLPELGVKLDPWMAGVLGLALNYAAYEAENYRAGIESVPAGQLEAAWTLGLTTGQAVRWVVMPQAVRVAIPPVTNDFISLLKDSSLVSVITMVELTKVYGSLASATRDYLGLGVVVAVWYLLIGLPFARLASYLERRMGKHLRRAAP